MLRESRPLASGDELGDEDDARRGRLEPASCRGARDSLSECVVDVAGVVNEDPETVVVPSLSSRGRGHGAIMSVDGAVGHSAG